MAIRRDPGRNAVVVRPPRPDGMRHTPVSVPVVEAREDSNEHIAVSRTVTPTDSQIRRALAKIDDPEARAELERVAKSARDHRLAYEQAIEQKHSDLEDALATLRRTGSHVARVFDRSGTTVGLLFLEDIIEELIGEVQDATRRRR